MRTQDQLFLFSTIYWGLLERPEGGFSEGEEKGRSPSWGSWRWRLAVLLSQDGRQDRHELVPGFVDLSGEVGREA